MSAATNSRTERPDTLVYGLGSTGLSVARHLSGRGIDALYVDSRANPPGLDALRRLVPDAQVAVGSLSGDLLRDVSQIVVSPGIADNDELLVEARATHIDIVSDVELFAQTVAADCVAITGSNGKSTVTTLVAMMCEAAGLRVLAGANLGTPALDLLASEVPDVYVLELSSFQLQRTRSLEPKVAALLNVTADHLDWHASEAEYVEAKRRIFDNAAAAVVNRDDPVVMERLPTSLPVITFGLGAPGREEFGVIERSGERYLARGDAELINVRELALVGQHNQANALAALAIAEMLGLDVRNVIDVLREFRGLPHRMQLVAQIDGVDYINDSKATNVAAAIASVRSLPGRVVLLAGGQGKGGDFSLLARETADRLSAVIVFGEDAADLEKAFERKTAVSRVDGLGDAVRRAAELAEIGSTVLLAPACASFDQFPNYTKRGDAFVALVQELSQ